MAFNGYLKLSERELIYMKIIDEQIQWYDQNSTRKDDDLIKVNLKLINELVEKIEHSEDRIFIDKVVNTFCEIIEIQREVIDELDSYEANEANAPNLQYFVAQTDFKPNHIQWVGNEDIFDIVRLRELNPYKPSADGFRSDAQIKDAFANYLKYHLVKRNGQQKTLADSTIYDYCSRVKVLWEIFNKEQIAGKLGETFSQLDNEVLHGRTFMNAYNNISILKDYVELKSREIEEIEAGDRESFSRDELLNNPLNNPKNLRNTTAALAKFEEFKEKVNN